MLPRNGSQWNQPLIMSKINNKQIKFKKSIKTNNSYCDYYALNKRLTDT